MKKIIIALSMMLIILSMGCASAADDIGSNDIMAGNPSLQDLIDDADAGDSVILYDDYTLSEEIYIDKNLNILGNGHTVKSDGSCGLFTITSQVSFNNLTFEGGNSDYGGAVYLTSSVEFNNCIFINNYAENIGGAICAEYDDDGNPPVLMFMGENYFISNEANESGGAIAIRGTDDDYAFMIGNNMYFEDNRADTGGAIYASRTTAFITFSLFDNNIASTDGGAICSIKSNMLLNNDYFTGNTANDYQDNADDFGVYGGTIFAKLNLTVMNSYFSCDDEIDFIDYYNHDDELKGFLYLSNNTMEGANSYDIWFEDYTGLSPITSEIYLYFINETVESGDNFFAAYLLDDMGNTIRAEYVNIEISDKSTGTSEDEGKLYWDEDAGGFLYYSSLSDGTYALTGSVPSYFATDVTVIDGEVRIGSQSQKTTPKVTASYAVDGNSVTLTARLNPSNATGTVTFNVAGKSYDAKVQNGKATKTISNLAEGSYTVSTKYNGDDSYNEATAKSVSFTIGSTSPSEKTTPTVTTSCAVDGTSVTLTARLNPSDATGTVFFNIEGALFSADVKNGKATKTLSNFAEGSYKVSTRYNGDDNYNEALAKSVSFTIENAGPGEKTTPTVTTTYSKEGTVVTLTATVSPSDATGTVIFIVNGEEYNPVTVTNGKATKRLSGMPDGSYEAETIYSGDTNYYSAHGNDVNFVISTTGVVIDAPALVKFYGGSERFTVTLTKDGSPLSGKTVKITINGNTYERTTDSSGKAGMNINLNSNEYPVTVEAEGQKVTSTVTVKPTVSGNDITKIFRNGTQYYATFVDSKGDLLKNTNVEFNINGVFYTRPTNENGVARMNINLNPETYIITAKNPSTGEQYTNRITVLTNIIEHNDLTKYYKNDSQYRIRILADDGSIAKAGVKVTFNINGVFYDRYSDENGYVQMRINLNPGDYIITADYNGLRASNNIKVLNIISGRDVNMEYKDGTKYEVTLLDGQGRPYSGQTVRMNINGVFYDKVTDENGVARLSINLGGGSYVITSTYNGLSCSNTVNVVVPMQTFTVGNFKASVPKSCNVETHLNDDNTMLIYELTYENGEPAEIDIQYENIPVSEYIGYMESYYYARNIGGYNGWVMLDLSTLKNNGEDVPRYMLISADGTYIYQVESDNPNICKDIVGSFTR